jgi:hypothetical protein
MVRFVLIATALVLFILRYMGIDDIGVACVLTNIIPFVAPIEQLSPVFLEKNARYIDINVLVAALLNQCIWTAFGAITQDAFVLVPNAMGGLA